MCLSVRQWEQRHSHILGKLVSLSVGQTTTHTSDWKFITTTLTCWRVQSIVLECELSSLKSWENLTRPWWNWDSNTQIRWPFRLVNSHFHWVVIVLLSVQKQPCPRTASPSSDLNCTPIFAAFEVIVANKQHLIGPNLSLFFSPYKTLPRRKRTEWTQSWRFLPSSLPRNQTLETQAEGVTGRRSRHNVLLWHAWIWKCDNGRLLHPGWDVRQLHSLLSGNQLGVVQEFSVGEDSGWLLWVYEKVSFVVDERILKVSGEMKS